MHIQMLKISFNYCYVGNFELGLRAVRPGLRFHDSGQRVPGPPAGGQSSSEGAAARPHGQETDSHHSLDHLPRTENPLRTQ